jgi:hypothetical protein
MLKAYLVRIGQLKSISVGGGENPTSETAPFLVIKAVPTTAPNKIEIENVRTRRLVEVTGTIEFGHDAAGGNYFVNIGKDKHYTLAHPWDIDDVTEQQLSKLSESNAKVTVKGTIEIWKDGTVTFDNAQPVSIFK